MDNFVTDNHCRNVKRLVRLGFRLGEPSAFMTNAKMTKHGRSYFLTILPIDGIIIVSDDTSDPSDENFISDDCRTWEEVIDSLARRKAITERQRMKIKEEK